MVLKALLSRRGGPHARLVVIGDYAVFARAARQLRRRLPAWRLARPSDAWHRSPAPLTFIDCGHSGAFIPGRPSRAAGKAALAYIEHAVALWRAKRIHGLVTAPVTKWAIEQSSPHFVGQTEHLARAMGRRDVVMMFVSHRLRIVLLTRHLALRDVARSLDRRLVRVTLRLTADALRQQFGIRRPRLAVCGLNPHAGESGLLGREERWVLRPVMRAAQRAGLVCDGPFAADGFFADAGDYDAVVCCYHDQGLIPFKMAARDRGCQMTIGLPLVRTSPDHGSALDIAGRGVADPGSMRYALDLAIALTERHVARDL